MIICFLIYNFHDGEQRSWGIYLFGASVLGIVILFLILILVLFIFLVKILARLTQQRISGNSKNLTHYSLHLKVIFF